MHPVVFVYHFGVALLCVARRRHAFGGWLLFYLTELVVYGFVRIATGAMSMSGDAAGFSPGHWDHIGEWFAFLLVTLPLPVLAVVQLETALGAALRPRLRNPARLRRLRWVLGLELVAALVVIVVDAMLWPRLVERDLNLVLWPLLWGSYFLQSRRARMAFGEESAEAGFTWVPGP